MYSKMGMGGSRFLDSLLKADTGKANTGKANTRLKPPVALRGAAAPLFHVSLY
jgi:hypothetical protein